MSNVSEKVIKIISVKIGVSESDIDTSSSFIKDLGADSMDVYEMMMEFEKEFGIRIPDEDAEKIQTVGDTIAYLEGKVG